MSITAIIVLAVSGAVLSLVVKKYSPEFSVVIALGVTVAIFISLMDEVEYITQKLNELMGSLGNMGEFAPIIFKALGVCILTQIASDTCKDAGENSIASKLEIAGKITVIFMSMPLIFRVLEISQQLIAQGVGA